MRWSKREQRILIATWGRQHPKQIARDLRRSVLAVYQKARQLRLPSRRELRCTRKLDYCVQFRVSVRKMRLYSVDQLDACADDSARRVLLGVGEKFGAGEIMDPVVLPKKKPVLSEYVAEVSRRVMG